MGKEIPLAYDCTLKKVGCVILQAAMGGSSDVANRFDSRHWILYPTPNLRVYMLPEEKIEQLIEITKAAHANQSQTEGATEKHGK